ncbi:MAG TPA: DUF2378 family protein [Myxococcaceae bacterium]|nr:DUF2378 family protein [Myxococcaceae bacterium]
MDTRKRLEARKNEATQRDVLLGIFFESTLEQMADVLGIQKMEELRPRSLRKVVSFFRYPVSDLLELLEQSIQGEANDTAFDEAVRQYGRAAVTFFFASPVGKTMAMLAGDSPQRLLSSAPSGFKAVTTFGERDYAKTGENSAVLNFKGDLLGPAWECGVIEQAITQLNQKAPKLEVKVLNESASDFSISVSW